MVCFSNWMNSYQAFMGTSSGVKILSGKKCLLWWIVQSQTKWACRRYLI